jgi:[ribosomal protein S18]-alanine N-acetyltransferase
MQYRLYKPEDFAALYAIEEVCFQPPFRFARSFMQRLVDAPFGEAWVAEEDGKVAGFAIVEWTTQAKRPTAYIQTIEMLPEHRGRGAGGELLARIEQSATEAGAAVLWLHVDESNAPAIRLYEACGFTRTGKEEHFYAPGRGALLYRKQLGQERTPRP